MTRFPLLSRAVATATAALGACALACALQAMYASPASAFTPSASSSAGGGENTPLNLNTSTSASHSTTSTGGASITRTIVGLAIVIAVIWGLAWILRQVKAGREGGRDSHPSGSGLTNIAALTLSNGRSVHLVRAGSEYVLLGSAEHGVVPIARYTEEEARDAGLVPGTRDRRVEEHSPVVGARPDPMRMAEPSSGVIERLRELTVRR